MTHESSVLLLETLMDQIVSYRKEQSDSPCQVDILNTFPLHLTHIRKLHRETYSNAQSVKQQNSAHREAAMRARIAKLNRDWYKSHLEADITSYERADLEFNPDDLISIQDLQQTLAPQELQHLSAKEIMIKRFQHERLARLRAYGQVTQKQHTKKSLQTEMLAVLAQEEAMERSILHSIQGLQEVAKTHGISLEQEKPQEESNEMQIDPTSSHEPMDEREDGEQVEDGNEKEKTELDTRSPSPVLKEPSLQKANTMRTEEPAKSLTESPLTTTSTLPSSEQMEMTTGTPMECDDQ